MSVGKPSRLIAIRISQIIIVLAIFAALAGLMKIHDGPVRSQVTAAPALWRGRLPGLLGRKRSDVITLLNTQYGAGYSLGDTSREFYPGPERRTKTDHVVVILGDTYAPPFTWIVAIDLSYDRRERLISYSIDTRSWL